MISDIKPDKLTLQNGSEMIRRRRQQVPQRREAEAKASMETCLGYSVTLHSGISALLCSTLQCSTAERAAVNRLTRVRFLPGALAQIICATRCYQQAEVRRSLLGWAPGNRGCEGSIPSGPMHLARRYQQQCMGFSCLTEKAGVQPEAPA